MRIILAAIYPFAFLLLYLIIPFDNYIRVLPNILLAILVIAFPFAVTKEDFKKLINPSFLVFLLLFFFLLLNSTIVGRIGEDWKVISKVGVAVGLVLLYTPISNTKPSAGKTGKIETAIIFSALAAILFSIYNFVLIADATGNFALGESPQVVEALLTDRLYLGILSLLSIMVSYRAISPKFNPNNNYYLSNIAINVVFIVLIASKVALVILFLLLLLRIFYAIKKKFKFVFLGIVFLVIVCGYFLLKSNVNSQATNVSSNKFTEVFQKSNTWEVRALVWQCFDNIIKTDDFTVFGIGFVKTKDRLADCYASNILNVEKREMFVSERFNTHNQFFDFYLSAGFLALLLFCLFIIVSFIYLRKNYYTMSMLSILVLYCLIENVFHRQMGAYYIGFILLMLLSGNTVAENNNLKK